MLRMILAGKYEFSSPEWDDRSDTVKDLVCVLVSLIRCGPVCLDDNQFKKNLCKIEWKKCLSKFNLFSSQ